VLELVKKGRTDDAAATVDEYVGEIPAGESHASYTHCGSHIRGAVLVSHPAVDEPVGRLSI
jgi:hypothetical protein